MVHGRNGRTAGHASLAGRPADSRILSGQQPRSASSSAGSKSFRTPLAAGHRAQSGTTCSTMRGLTVDRQRRLWLVVGAGRVSRRPPALSRAFSHASRSSLRTADFEPEFRRLFADDWEQLTRRVASLRADHRLWLRFRSHGDRLSTRANRSGPHEGRAKIDVEHGWQSSRLRLEAGKTYELSATRPLSTCRRAGRLVVRAGGRDDSLLSRSAAGNSARPRSMPIARRSHAPAPADSAPAVEPRTGRFRGRSLGQPIVVGLHTTLSPAQSGTLYLRVNEPAGELADNSGTRRARGSRGSGETVAAISRRGTSRSRRRPVDKASHRV